MPSLESMLSQIFLAEKNCVGLTWENKHPVVFKEPLMNVIIFNKNVNKPIIKWLVQSIFG
jgi:hypothetical protein